ncbi:TIGR01777 family oxidoreductase [Bacillus carboniphilus]|uniref:TIGR01777 family oxidoreductase n=1 Tax=Bacillus carboniphilus TaxID=86663 RepID=A0ABY9JVA8_9BACI|nr:TIGR01777 family oxidoreductase [Bacillus carboniphilus]WLR42668.1 TIGR01777 family oxidoreductase [Bacillus carboniphilus]
MHIAITGGTGFVGQYLSEYLLQQGHKVSILTRQHKTSSNVQYIRWLSDGASAEKQLEGVDAIINLAGKSINTRWTPKAKEKIVSSRVKATQEVIRIIDSLNTKPKVLINASAIGIYGTSETKTFDEDSETREDDFLAYTVTKWEREAKKAEQKGIRTVYLRLGIVLGNGGALPKMVLPYKLNAGGKLGSGKQWLSWVHVKDVARLSLFCIENSEIKGPVNATAPHPKRMDDFGKTIASVLNKSYWLPAPSLPIKIALGEMSMLLLKGQYVECEKATQQGFQFEYSQLKEAFKDLLQ